MKTYVFDIESNGFLEQMDRIHCISIRCYETDEVFEYGPSEIEEGLKKLQEPDVLVAHNGLSFDIPAIKKIFPNWATKAKIYDTLIAAKFAFPDIKERDFRRLGSVMRTPQKMRTDFEKRMMRNIGRHSLEAYGLRLGEYKGDFGKEVGFETFSEDMMTYCTQDVKVNTKLYHKLVSMELDQEVLHIEFEARRICNEQQNFGFPFNITKALELKDKLETRQKELQDEIQSILGGPFIIPLEVKVPKRDINYKDVLRGSERKGCPYTKIKVKEFNPTSRHDLSTRLIERFNWKPRVFGADRKPTLDEAVLKNCDIPITKEISELFLIQKRMGMLADGQNAWLKLYNAHTKAIHGGIDTLGTGTHRCTHNRPNLGQIPSVRAPWGKECRELFGVPEGWQLFGTDAAGLELRMLAHYMHPFDDGDYANEILSGDIHTKNQEGAGLPTRNNAKTFIYAFLYGAGDEKIGSIIGGGKAQGRAIKKKFFETIPAMKRLTDGVKQAAELRGYVKSLDGRRIPVKSTHAALNYLLQSAGAIVCKNWMVRLHEILKENGYEHGVDFKQSAYVHDELQIAFNPDRLTGEQLGEYSKQAMIDTGKKLKVRMPLDIGYDVGVTYADTH